MGEWRQKRFWQSVDVASSDEGYAVRLDGRTLRTPAKAAFVVPSRALAEAAAAEWAAQEGEIHPGKMPVTRAINSAIDKVTPQRVAVLDMLLSYAETDLVCYRAEGPAGLVARQTEAWDPCLAWVRDRFGVEMLAVAGVMHFPQPAEVGAVFRAHVTPWSAHKITGLHDLVTLSGSFVLGLAVAEGRFDAAEAWALSCVDEDWQAAQWGRDDEAEAASAEKAQGFAAAARYLSLLDAEDER